MKAIEHLVHTVRVYMNTFWMGMAALWLVLCVSLISTYPLNATVGVIGTVIFAFLAWLDFGGIHGDARKPN